MDISRQFAIKAQHEFMRYQAMQMLNVEIQSGPIISYEAYRKRMAYWLVKFHHLHLN